MKSLLKNLLLLIFIVASNGLAQQKYYTFSELRGMEDQNSNTHLFYRLYYYHGTVNYEDLSNDIYHLDISNGVDTLFLNSGSHSDPAFQSGGGADEVNFWDNDPTKFVYIETSCGIDCDGGIVRYDGTQINFGIDLPTKIGISKQNDSLLFIGTFSSVSYESTNGGKSITELNDTTSFYSLYPYNDKIMFGNYNGNLAKSTDGGNSFKSLSYSMNLSPEPKIFYDKDSLHIYLLRFDSLFVSDDIGETWQEKFNVSQSSYIDPFISIDGAESGSIYLAYGIYIFHSTNYGNSFSLYHKLSHDIVGIYKKPNSNKLYAATKYKLFEINNDSIKTLKSLPIDPKIFNYYPLSLGNKWVYDYSVVRIDNGGSFVYLGKLVRKITGDTVISNIKYYVVNDKYDSPFLNSISYERIDSATGKIFIYNPDDTSGSHESLLLDLTSEIGDTNSVIIPFEREMYPLVYLKDTMTNELGVNESKKIYKATYNNITYSLADSLGIDKFNDPFGEYDPGSKYTLIGCYINGKVYGDTTITGIKDTQKSPDAFSLSQNYPNPFNPATKIQYSIPTVVDAKFASTLVQLKVYNILGCEVATLVNEKQAPGNYKVKFNSTNLPSGIYFYRLTYGDYSKSMKMILLK